MIWNYENVMKCPTFCWSGEWLDWHQHWLCTTAMNPVWNNYYKHQHRHARRHTQILSAVFEDNSVNFDNNNYISLEIWICEIKTFIHHYVSRTSPGQECSAKHINNKPIMLLTCSPTYPAWYISLDPLVSVIIGSVHMIGSLSLE